MNQQNKVFVSAAGVLMTAGAVAGVALAAGHSSTPKQRPAGNVGVVAPATVTVSATVTASPKPTVTVKVSPSRKKAAPRKRAAVVQNKQGDPVTDPQPPADDNPPAADPTTSDPAPQIIDNGSGTVDQGGVRRAPAPGTLPPPPPMQHVPSPSPSS